MRLEKIYLWVDDVPAAVEFYGSLGCACALLRDDGPLGAYAEVDAGGVVLGLAERSRAARALGEERANGTPWPFQLSFTTPDPAIAYAEAINADCVSIAAPYQSTWGPMISRVEAPGKTVIQFVEE